MDFTNDIISLSGRLHAVETLLVAALPGIVDAAKLDQWAIEAKANTNASGMDPRAVAKALEQIDQWVAAIKQQKQSSPQT